MIKRFIKKIIPNKMIQIVRVGKNIRYYETIIKSIQFENSDTIYLIGTPIHENLGDHLITMAELEFLKELFPTRKIIEIPTEIYQIYKDKLIDYISNESMIFINGGGWMGNLWVKEELLIQDIVKTFSKNRVIIFPQTIFYKQGVEPYAELIQSAKSSFERCNRLLLTVRDEQSYLFAKQNFPNTKCILVPDIALYFYGKKEYKNNVGKLALFCLREDREISRGNIDLGMVKKILNDKGYLQGQINTINKFRVSETQRKRIVENRLYEFSKADLIITDRLHGMIFSFIVGVPCIIIDNSTGKVFGVYNKWLKESKSILPLYEETTSKLISQFIDNSTYNSDCRINIDFSELKEEIYHG